jgi:hypothetical protein
MRIKILQIILFANALLSTYSNTEPTQFEKARKYQIINTGTQKCIQFDKINTETININCSENPSNFWFIEKNPEGWHIIRSAVSSQVMDITESSKDIGANMHTWDWKQKDNQKWYLNFAEDNQFLIKNKNSGKCLKVSNNIIIQHTCNTGDPLQRFTFKKGFKSTIEAGNWAIVNKKEFKCLSYVANNADVSATSYSNATPNFWAFEFQDDYTHIIKSIFSGQVLDVTGKSKEEGAVIHSWSTWSIWGYGIKDNQKWFVDFVDKEYFIVRALHSNKCLTLKGNKYVQSICNAKDSAQLFKAIPQNVRQISKYDYYSIINKGSDLCLRWQDANSDIIHSQCDLSEANFWEFEKYENWYAIKSLINNQVLDVTGKSTEAGAIIHNWKWKEGDNQKWFVEYVNEDWFMLRSRNSNKCLSTLRDKFSQEYCQTTNDKQLFKLKERPVLPTIKNNKTALVNKVTKKCMEYNYLNEYIIHSECDWGDVVTYWKFEKRQNFYIISSNVNKKVIEVGNRTENGSKVLVGDNYMYTYQKWIVDFVDLNYFMLRNLSSDKCLTVTDSFFTQNTCSSTDGSQLFIIQSGPSLPPPVTQDVKVEDKTKDAVNLAKTIKAEVDIAKAIDMTMNTTVNMKAINATADIAKAANMTIDTTADRKAINATADIGKAANMTITKDTNTTANTAAGATTGLAIPSNSITHKIWTYISPVDIFFILVLILVVIKFRII